MSRSYALIVCAVLVTAGLFVASCAEDNLPAAPAKCQETPTALTPWFTVDGNPGSCTSPSALAGTAFQARAGVVYYGAGTSLCAVDASGVRTIGSTILPGHVSWGFVQALWLDGDRVVFTDGYGVYSVPIAGGDVATLFSFTVDDAPFGGTYDFDGTFVYWGSGVENSTIFRRAVAGGASEKVASYAGFTVAEIRVAGDRVDFTAALIGGGIGSLRRVPIGGSATVGSIDLSTSGALLASAGDLTYVRYARAPLGSGANDDSKFDLGVTGSDGNVQSAWTGDVPQLMPTAASVQGGTLYAGGRLHYHGGQTFVGVAAVAIGATTGEVLGCFPTVLAPNREWAVVFATAADETGTYALVDRTSASGVEYAVVRFPGK